MKYLAILLFFCCSLMAKPNITGSTVKILRQYKYASYVSVVFFSGGHRISKVAYVIGTDGNKHAEDDYLDSGIDNKTFYFVGVYRGKNLYATKKGFIKKWKKMTKEQKAKVFENL